MLLIIVHRLLQSFVFPPLNAMLIIIIGLILFKLRKKYALYVMIFGLIFLYIQSIPLTAYKLNKAIELPPLNESLLEGSQAIVVLGGGVNGNSYEYQDGVSAKAATLVRLAYTSYLAKKYPNKLIVTSGGYTGINTEAKVMRDTLINNFGVKNKIIIENKSRNTDENAEFVAKILLPMGIKNVILITQAYHMKRAMMLFEKYNLNPTAASTDYYNNYDALTPALSMIPNASAMQQVYIIGHEYLGYSWYCSDCIHASFVVHH